MFSKDEIDFFNNIDKLPDELIRIIKSFTPKCVTIFLNKTNYMQEHYLVRKWLNKYNIEQYIRTMIRQDNDFILQQLLVENTNKWLKMTKYLHRDEVFVNYLYFIKSYAHDNESYKCEKIIISKLEELGLSKNQHKKNRFNYI